MGELLPTVDRRLEQGRADRELSDAEHQRVVDALCEGYDDAGELEAMHEDDARREAGW